MELSLIKPEIFLATMASLTLLVGLYVPENRRYIISILTQISLFGTIAILIHMDCHSQIITFNGAFIVDPLSILLKVFILLIVMVCVSYSESYLKSTGFYSPEYYVLLLFCTLGMLGLCSAGSFVSLYLSIELYSLPLYCLIAFNPKQPYSHEAALKYFVMGAIASGMLLFGTSLVYGATGSLQFGEIAQKLQELTIPGQYNVFLRPVLIGIVFIMASIAFKFGAAPFHMWLPDVYQGAPMSMTMFIATAPKIAALGMSMRVLFEVFDVFTTHNSAIEVILAILAVASISLGNFVALVQTNLKRMLAYSTIAHIGFIMMALLTSFSNGLGAATIYTIVYAVTSLGAFGILLILSYRKFEAENLDDLKGLADTHPWLALMMMIHMLSLAGVPPTVGFFAKFNVIAALLNTHDIKFIDTTALAVFALVMSVVGAFYYLRVVRIMFFDNLAENSPLRIKRVTSSGYLLASMNGLGILFVGIMPALFTEMIVEALRQST